MATEFLESPFPDQQPQGGLPLAQEKLKGVSSTGDQPSQRFDDFFFEHTLILIVVDCGHEQQRNDRSGADNQDKILAQEVVSFNPFTVVGKVF